MRSLIIFLIVLSSGPVSARVFNFGSESLSTYLRGTGGFSGLKKGAFENSSGATTTFSEKVEFNFSGEIGLTLSLSAFILRIGVEGLVPQDMSPAVGNDASGTKIMDLNSEILAIIPKVTLEFVLYSDGGSRLIAGIGVGKGNITVKNAYVLNTDGQTAFPGVSDYSEVGKGSALGGDVFLGIESLFVDNVTFTAEVGYRLYEFKELEHDSAVTTFVGTVAKGDPVLNHDGSARSIDMKGLFAGVGLRFYIDFPN